VATTYKEVALAAATSLLTTELNSLANATLSTASAVYDNSTNLYVFFGVEFHLAAQGSARTAGGNCILYMSQDLVGASTQDLTVESQVFTSQVFDAATNARTHTQSGLWLPPSASMKFALYNNTGQALAATLNTVKLIPWYTQSV
jgi:hypothetical protein